MLDLIFYNGIVKFIPTPESAHRVGAVLAAVRAEIRQQILQHVDSPVVSHDGFWDPIAAGTFFNQARQYLEQEMQQFAVKYSATAWLYYLRRLPRFFFAVSSLPTNELYVSDLAEIVTGLNGGPGPTRYSSVDPLNYWWDASVIQNLIWLCAAAQQLKFIHAEIRRAGKGIKFAVSDDAWPEAQPTEIQQEAIITYDSRNQNGYQLFTARAGTILSNNLPGSTNPILTVARTYQYPIDVPRDQSIDDGGNIASFGIAPSTLEEVNSLPYRKFVRIRQQV